MFSKRANGKSQMNSPESKRIEYMRTEHIHLVVLAILLICAFAVCLGKGEETNMASHLQERLQVVGKQLREAREKLQAMDQKFFKDYIPLNETPDATFNDPDPPSYLGNKVMIDGDVNGDGYNDILIGARHAGGKESNGAAYLFLGNTQEKMDSVCDYTFRGESPNAQMGSALELFDVDNDGFDDVIIGVRYADHARGKVYIHWGAKDFDANKPAVVLDGESYKSNMPSDCITCGHIDDDDYGDILCGALHYPPYNMSDGRAYLFCGNRKQLMDVECDMVFDPQEDHNNFGSLSISLGDVNNDGYLDALFAAGGQLPECNGKAFLYYGPLVENHTSNDEVLDGTKEKQQTKKAAKKEIQSLKEQIDQLEQEYATLIAGAAPAAAASYVLCW